MSGGGAREPRECVLCVVTCGRERAQYRTGPGPGSITAPRRSLRWAMAGGNMDALPFSGDALNEAEPPPSLVDRPPGDRPAREPRRERRRWRRPELEDGGERQ